MEGAKVYFGVDIGKEHLDVACRQVCRRFGNEGRGHNELVSWLKQWRGPQQVICEASGGYERGMVKVLQQSGVPVSLVQASRVRQFAWASGLLAKTDRIDARLLCAYGEAITPGPSRAWSAEQERLRALDEHRRHLSRILVMEQNRQGGRRVKELVALQERLIRQIERQLAKLDSRSRRRGLSWSR